MRCLSRLKIVLTLAVLVGMPAASYRIAKSYGQVSSTTPATASNASPPAYIHPLEIAHPRSQTQLTKDGVQDSTSTLGPRKALPGLLRAPLEGVKDAVLEPASHAWQEKKLQKAKLAPREGFTVAVTDATGIVVVQKKSPRGEKALLEGTKDGIEDLPSAFAPAKKMPKPLVAPYEGLKEGKAGESPYGSEKAQ